MEPQATQVRSPVLSPYRTVSTTCSPDSFPSAGSLRGSLSERGCHDGRAQAATLVDASHLAPRTVKLTFASPVQSEVDYSALPVRSDTTASPFSTANTRYSAPELPSLPRWAAHRTAGPVAAAVVRPPPSAAVPVLTSSDYSVVGQPVTSAQRSSPAASHAWAVRLRSDNRLPTGAESVAAAAASRILSSAEVAQAGLARSQSDAQLLAVAQPVAAPAVPRILSVTEVAQVPQAGAPLQQLGRADAFHGDTKLRSPRGTAAAPQIVEVPRVQLTELLKEVPRPEVVQLAKPVTKPEVQVVEKLVEVPWVQFQERIIEVPQVEQRRIIKHVPRYEVRYLDRHVPRLDVQYVERFVEVPHVIEQERIVEVPEVEYCEVMTKVGKPVMKYTEKLVPKVMFNYMEETKEDTTLLHYEQPVEVPQVLLAELSVADRGLALQDAAKTLSPDSSVPFLQDAPGASVASARPSAPPQASLTRNSSQGLVLLEGHRHPLQAISSTAAAPLLGVHRSGSRDALAVSFGDTAQLGGGGNGGKGGGALDGQQTGAPDVGRLTPVPDRSRTPSLTSQPSQTQGSQQASGFSASFVSAAEFAHAGRRSREGEAGEASGRPSFFESFVQEALALQVDITAALRTS